MVFSSRWAVRQQHPITKALFEIFGSGSDTKVKKQRNRTGDEFGLDQRNEVVSEQLCDDVIKYLAPTLEQHKGCTIIDINPGACLWSAKLHDFLRPKRHLLMEDDKRYYEPFIKKLLDKPDSTYRHTFMSGAHPQHYWENFREVFRNPELAPREALPEGDPGRLKFDPGLLVTGSLARSAVAYRRSNSVSFSAMILQQVAHATLANELYHNAGLVRMLWWLPELEKPTFFPNTEVHRRALNAQTSLPLSTTEVVGCGDLCPPEITHYTRRRQRPDFHLALSARNVEQSARRLGMELPEGREYLYEWPKEGSLEAVSPLFSRVRSIDDLERQLATIEKRAKEVFSSKERAKLARKPSQDESKLMETIEFPQCAKFADTFEQRRGVKTSHLILFSDLALQLVRLEVGYKIVEESQDVESAKLEEFRKRIIRIGDRADSGMVDMSPRSIDWIHQGVDEQIAVYLDPPILALEARRYEPLKAASTDFWPENNLMLFDMMPKGRDLSVPDLASTAEGAKVSKMLIKSIMSSPKITLAAALDRIAPNAAQDLLPAVPAASDPRRGGRLDPFRIRSRMVSEDIMEGLVKAWIEWPFKPQTMELELAAESDSSLEVPDDEEVETDAKEKQRERPRVTNKRLLTSQQYT